MHFLQHINTSSLMLRLKIKISKILILKPSLSTLNKYDQQLMIIYLFATIEIFKEKYQKLISHINF